MTDDQIIEAAIQGHANTRDAIRWAMKQVRGDAEPVAYIGTDGTLGWLKKPEALYSKAVPLFKHPAPAEKLHEVGGSDD